MKKIVSVLAGFGLAVAALAQVDPARVVATVNGEAIKGAEYYHRMEFLPGVGKRIGNNLVEFPPGFLTLEQLITEKLVIQLAKQQGVYPSDAEVQAELRAREEDDPQLQQDWLASGKTEADLLDQLRVELCQFKIQTAGINITDQQVSTYYKEHPNFFTIPQRYKLRTIVVTSDEAKKAVDADLAAGKSFADVAKARSEDLTKVSGGDFGTIPLSAIPDSSQSTIQSTKIGSTTDWIDASGSAKSTAWAKFLVENVLPAQLQDLTPSLQRSIRRQMMLEGGKGKNDVAKEMAAMRKTAKISIAEKAFSDAYAKFVDSYLKQQDAKAGGQ